MGTLAQPRLGRPFGRRIVSLGRELRGKALHDDVATQASALTFTAFLSIFPLLLLATSLVGFRLEGRGMASINELVSTIPGLTQLVAGQAQTIVDGRFTAGIVGLAGLVWAASALSNRARRALGVSFGHQETAIASRFEAVVDTFVLGALLIVGATVAGLVANVAHDRSRASPIPFRRCSGTTAIDSSGILSSTKPYPGSSAVNSRYHAAPTGRPSTSATTPPSPSRPHPW